MMDILGQYDRQRAQAAEKPITYSQFPIEIENAGIVVRILNKILGGKIQNERQVNITLGIVIGFLLLATAFIFFGSDIAEFQVEVIPSPIDRNF